MTARKHPVEDLFPGLQHAIKQMVNQEAIKWTCLCMAFMLYHVPHNKRVLAEAPLADAQTPHCAHAYWVQNHAAIDHQCMYQKLTGTQPKLNMVSQQAARQTYSTRLQYASRGHSELILFGHNWTGLSIFSTAHTCTNFTNDNEEMASRHLQAEVPQQRNAPCLPGKAAIVDEHCWAARGGSWGHLGVPQLLLLLAGMTTLTCKQSEMLCFVMLLVIVLLVVCCCTVESDVCT